MAYFRFKDDIIAFLDGPNNNPDLFFATLSRESSPFTLELESVAPSEVAFFRRVFIQTARGVQIQLQGA